MIVHHAAGLVWACDTCWKVRRHEEPGWVELLSHSFDAAPADSRETGPVTQPAQPAHACPDHAPRRTA